MIDTSSSELPPRDVRLAAQALRDAASRWVHISTVSVYSGWPHQTLTESSEVLDCPSDADKSFGHTGSDGSPTKYGYQKAGGERAVSPYRAGARARRVVPSREPRSKAAADSSAQASGEDPKQTDAVPIRPHRRLHRQDLTRPHTAITPAVEDL